MAGPGCGESRAGRVIKEMLLSSISEVIADAMTCGGVGWSDSPWSWELFSEDIWFPHIYLFIFKTYLDLNVDSPMLSKLVLANTETLESSGKCSNISQLRPYNISLLDLGPYFD